MTVKDLIEKLKTFDPEMLVVTRGMDECGYANIAKFEIVKVVAVNSDLDPFGDYREAPSNKNAEQALLIDHC